MIRDNQSLQKLAQFLQAEPIWAFDVESSGLDWYANDKVEGVSFAGPDWQEYITLNYRDPQSSITRETFTDIMGPLFEDDKARIIGHNVVFDMHMLYHTFGIVPKARYWDSMSMCHTLFETLDLNQLGLKTLTKLILGREPLTFEQGYQNQDLETQANYAAADARNTFDLGKYFSAKLISAKLYHWYLKYAVPLNTTVFWMEERGMRVDDLALTADKARLEQMLVEADAHILDVVAEATGAPIQSVVWLSPSEKKARKHPKPKKFNPRSSVNVEKAMNMTGYKLPKTNKGRPRTDSALIERLAQEGSVIAQALAGRNAVAKLLAYIYSTAKTKGGLQQLVKDDGRVRPNWNQCGTVNWRFSCSRPNLQNIPRPETGEDMGINPRTWFVAAPGYQLIVSDFCQLETRMLAMETQDPALIAVCNSGEDIHASTAATLFKIAIAEVTKDLRRIGKTINFGIIYGLSSYGLAQRLNCSEPEATTHINTFFARFPKVAQWIQDTHRDAVYKGEVWTMFGGRRRPVFVTRPPNDPIENAIWKLSFVNEVRKHKSEDKVRDRTRLPGLRRGRACRQAVNSVIQRSAAELVITGMNWMTQQGHPLIAQVHDEVILEWPENDLTKGIAAVRAAWPEFVRGVSLPMDTHTGHSWACGKE